MSWITQLSKTYDNLEKSSDSLKRCYMPLVPVSHTVIKAHLEIILNEESEIIQIREVEYKDSLTISPCTENSASRSSGSAPHILYDNLKNIAEDAYLYEGKEKTKENYENYREQLRKWCLEETCPKDIHIIYNYISQNNIINDLVSRNLLKVENMQLKWKGGKDNKPTDALSTFIRFVVEHKDGTIKSCNSNSEIINSYIEYDKKNYTQKKLCFASGEEKAITYKHSGKIRSAGDMSKLISANDISGFTFRGRFKKAEDAFSVGYDISYKAHSALRWLVANQGFATGEQVVVIWATDCSDIPKAEVDTEDIICRDEDTENESMYTPLNSYANKIEKAINGYKVNLDDKFNVGVDVMIIEAATPGRLSIKYYQEMLKSDYLEKIKKWHMECIWNHDYKIMQIKSNEEGKEEKNVKHIKFTGAPSINDIIFASYGKTVDDKLKKHIVERLISCTTGGRKIPRDIVMKAVTRFSQITDAEGWEIRKSSSVTCALLRKYFLDYEGVKYNMAIDYECKDRSYLFGRVLAYAERIEKYALYIAKVNERSTNALRFKSQFQRKPSETLEYIDRKLSPYVDKIIKTKGGDYLYQGMKKVISEISTDDFNNKPLEPLYILGYSAQSIELQKGQENKEDSEENNADEKI